MSQFLTISEREHTSIDHLFKTLTITATYSALPTFDVMVTNGTGEGNYYAGAG